MRLAFVLESNTDARILEGLSQRTELTVLARQRKLSEFAPRNGRSFRVIVGPNGRVAYAAWVARALRTRRFDALLVQGYFAAALGAGLAGRRPTLYVCNPMERYYRCRRSGEWPGQPYRPVELMGLQLCARVNARLAGAYAVLSEHLADEVRAHGARTPIDVIPAYGVDTAVFTPAVEPRRQVRATLGLPEEDPIVFFPARIAPEKDAGTLLAALAELRSHGRRLWLLSCAREHERLRSAAAAAGLDDRLLARDMVPPGSALARHYQAADLVVQASREEGLGFAPLEALACGTPVVAAAVGGLRETVHDGRTGWSYPVGDASALAAAIADALDHPDEARRRTAAGAAMVAERYAPGDAFDRLVALAAS